MHGVTPEFADDMMYLTMPLLLGVFGYTGLLMYRERIPPNAVFGLRTPRTRADASFWYAANKAAGGYILAADLVSAAALVALVVIGTATWQTESLSLTIPLGIAVALSLVWHQRH